MNRKGLLKRLGKRMSANALSLIGIDNVTYSRVARRSDLVRLGSEQGSWTIPSSLFGPMSVCYCVGCGEDISFDLALVDRFGCDVFGFDPTPRAVTYVKSKVRGNQKYHFTALGIWDSECVVRFYAPKDPTHVSHSVVNLQDTNEYFEAKVCRLSQIMTKNGHRSLDLLKLDVEGAEYKILDTIIEDRLQVRVLCVEYDEFFNPIDEKYRDRISLSVRALMAYGYSLVYSKGNANYTFVKES